MVDRESIIIRDQFGSVIRSEFPIAAQFHSRIHPDKKSVKRGALGLKLKDNYTMSCTGIQNTHLDACSVAVMTPY